MGPGPLDLPARAWDAGLSTTSGRVVALPLSKLADVARAAGRCCLLDWRDSCPGRCSMPGLDMFCACLCVSMQHRQAHTGCVACSAPQYIHMRQSLSKVMTPGPCPEGVEKCYECAVKEAHLPQGLSSKPVCHGMLHTFTVRNVLL